MSYYDYEEEEEVEVGDYDDEDDYYGYDYDVRRFFFLVVGLKCSVMMGIFNYELVVLVRENLIGLSVGVVVGILFGVVGVVVGVVFIYNMVRGDCICVLVYGDYDVFFFSCCFIFLDKYDSYLDCKGWYLDMEWFVDKGWYFDEYGFGFDYWR